MSAHLGTSEETETYVEFGAAQEVLTAESDATEDVAVGLD